MACGHPRYLSRFAAPSIYVAKFFPGGAISNLYYPEGSRHGFETTLNNTLIGIGTNAGVNLLQEFVFPKITPKLPKKAQSAVASSQ